MPAVVTAADIARLSGSPAGPLAPPGVLPLDARTGGELAAALAADLKRRYLTSTAPDGTAWRPLKYARASGASGGPLAALARFVTARATPDGAAATVNHPAAAAHDAGAVIRPRKAKHLAIPLTPEAARAGSPRRMKGTPGKPLFARKVGGRFVGHFLLVKRVTLLARPAGGVSAEGWRALAAVLAEAAARRWAAG